MKRERSEGCLFGTAIGDALAAPTEFIRDLNAMEKRFGSREKFELIGDPALVTDDTQMALAVAEALIASETPYTAQRVEGPIRAAFVEWMDSPENNRAPGMTCLSACRGLKKGFPWVQATVSGSKGCGANMRVQVVGLLDRETTNVAALAQFQAALTHGHPTALAASDLTAFAVSDLATGGSPGGLPDRLLDYARSQQNVYHEDWLGDLWQRPGVTSPEVFIQRGWDECIDVLIRLKSALEISGRESDPCLFTGEGWIAEEALATGLLCFLLYIDEPLSALRRAAYSSGDSDSIACLTGAFAGAYIGVSAWPEDWIARIEYRNRLQAIADWLS